jgi:hypothetical protein
MTSKKRKLDAVDEKFWNDIKDVSIVRQMKFREIKPKERSFREMTKLLRTAPSYPKVINELKTLPKKRRLKL